MFTTTDLNLAITLSYFGFSYELRKTEVNGRCEFCFEDEVDDGETLEEMQEAFYSKKCSVEPVKYFSVMKEVKNRIYSMR